MSYPAMNCCMQCGTRLAKQWNADEHKFVPYCPVCGQFQFPVFSAGVVMIIRNREQSHILMIRQFHDNRYYLVAGYIEKGENAEQAAVREIREEVGLTASQIEYNGSIYFSLSNTLLFSYVVTVENENVHSNEEVDDYCWFSPETADKIVPKHELAALLLSHYLHGSPLPAAL